MCEIKVSKTDKYIFVFFTKIIFGKIMFKYFNVTVVVLTVWMPKSWTCINLGNFGPNLMEVRFLDQT